MSLLAPRDTPASWLAMISPTSSLSSTFSDISHSSHASASTSKTDAFFASPFSPPPSASPLPSIASVAVSRTADFFASAPASAAPSPPPSLRAPSPASLRAPEHTPKPKPRLPPLARLFPSRYNSDPLVPRRAFHDADPAPSPFHGYDADPKFLTVASPTSYVDEDRYASSSSSSSGSPSDDSHCAGTADTHITVPSPVEALEPGSTVAGCELVKPLGRGGFSAVWLAKRASIGEHEGEGADERAEGRLVALKLAPRRDALAVRVFAREAAILGHIAHRNIVPLLASSFPSSASTPLLTTPEEYAVLTLPYYAHGDLLDLVNSPAHAQLTESQVRRMGRELVGAVGWLHGAGVGVAHRDIKLETQPLTAPLDPAQPLIALTDFGLARALAPGQLLSTRCGSEAYAAPELVLPPPPSFSRTHSRSKSEGDDGGKEEGGWYDARATDAWAVGCVLYALLARALPFGEGPPSPSPSPSASSPHSSAQGREARRAWLGRIAEGAWSWPSPSPSPSSHSAHTDAEEGELRGTQMVRSAGARRVVGALLTRERGRRATMAGVRADAWLADADAGGALGGDGEGEVRGAFGAAAWAEVE
ncbi:hypothetical protein HWV62_10593 [Athelia sp. TMB]|nr:hypothetical protein HWV62_10593 [Athelia sp. TMB]